MNQVSTRCPAVRHMSAKWQKIGGHLADTGTIAGNFWVVSPKGPYPALFNLHVQFERKGENYPVTINVDGDNREPACDQVYVEKIALFRLFVQRNRQMLKLLPICNFIFNFHMQSSVQLSYFFISYSWFHLFMLSRTTDGVEFVFSP